MERLVVLSFAMQFEEKTNSTRHPPIPAWSVYVTNNKMSFALSYNPISVELVIFQASMVRLVHPSSDDRNLDQHCSLDLKTKEVPTTLYRTRSIQQLEVQLVFLYSPGIPNSDRTSIQLGPNSAAQDCQVS